MVSTRSGGAKNTDEKAGDKRTASATTAKKPPAKKAKKEQDGKLEVGDNGEVGLAKEEDDAEGESEDAGDGETKGKGQDENGVGDARMTNERGEDETKGFTDARGDDADKSIGEMVQGEEASNGHDEGKEDNGAGDVGEETSEADTSKADAARQATPSSGGNEEPSHDATDVESLDDVSKFHILLLPKSGPHASSHYHRIIEVGKKKLPDPGAKRQNIWGLVGTTSTDKAGLKTAFGEYSYETKTKGTRHQPAARPAARGHYILHSPRDEAADSPDHNKQRDYKVLLAYEITTPPPEDFGRVQEELGLEQKGAVVLTIKDPDSGDNVQANPRAANMPREKKAHYPKHLHDLFGNRRWIAPNPVSFLDYEGTELLLMSSPHDLEDMLGKDGEKVEADMDQAAEKESTDIEGALKELGMSKGDVEIEALEGAWA